MVQVFPSLATPRNLAFSCSIANACCCCCCWMRLEPATACLPLRRWWYFVSCPIHTTRPECTLRKEGSRLLQSSAGKTHRAASSASHTGGGGELVTSRLERLNRGDDLSPNPRVYPRVATQVKSSHSFMEYSRTCVRPLVRQQESLGTP